MFGHDESGNSQQGNQGMMPASADNNGMSMPMGSGGMQNQPVQDMSVPADATTNSDQVPASYDQSPARSGQSSREADAAAPDDLISIKQEALQNLRPLVDHLDQTPEEKFRTTMMMIQAADDQGLIPQAYETAKMITDEKARAQALLDVVNEINYFTAQNTQQNQ